MNLSLELLAAANRRMSRAIGWPRPCRRSPRTWPPVMWPWPSPTGGVGTPWPRPDRQVPFPSNSWPKSSIARPRGRTAIGSPARCPPGRFRPRPWSCTGRVLRRRMPWRRWNRCCRWSARPWRRSACVISNGSDIRRLETILEIAGQWYQTREIEPLLVQMAEAATRLAEGGPGQHLPLGPGQPLPDRPAGLGREGRRAPRGRRPRRRRTRLAVGPARAGR